uniref:Uncharacterized protein n=1 Tax=Moniliophthora roreri TaxID=221103 RepID=A0A0W0FYR6_MONRR
MLLVSKRRDPSLHEARKQFLEAVHNVAFLEFLEAVTFLAIFRDTLFPQKNGEHDLRQNLEMRRKSAQKLSQELIDRIIDSLYEEGTSAGYKATRACALVNSKWVPRSRHHTFSHIFVKAPIEEFEQFFKQVTQYERLIELLRSPLFVNWIDPLFDQVEKWKSLTSLNLSGIEKETLNTAAWAIITQKEASRDVLEFRNRIQRLSLQHLPAIEHEDEFLALLNMIHLFPSLQCLSFNPKLFTEKLEVEGSTPPHEAEQQLWMRGLDEPRTLSLAQSALPAPAIITELELHSARGSNGVPYSVFYEWLRLSNGSLRVLDIRLDIMHELDYRSFARYLHSIGSSLESVNLTTAYYGRDTGDTTDFDTLTDTRNKMTARFESLLKFEPFIKCAALREVTVERLFLYELFNKSPITLIPIDTFVSALCGQSLKQLKLIMWTDLARGNLDKEAEENSWRRADELLAGDAFPALESVIISLSIIADILFDKHFDAMEIGRQRKTVIGPYLRSLFPRCHDKGILKIVFPRIDLDW